MAAEGAPPPVGSTAWIAGLLRDRLGPSARLTSIDFEGRLVHVRGLRVPIGVGHAGLADLEVVTLELGGGAAIPSLPIALGLVALRGTVLERRLDFTARRGDDPAWIEGALRVGELTLDVSVRPSASPRERDRRADVRITRGEATLSGFTYFRGASHDPLLVATLAGATAELVDAITSALALPRAPLPVDARVRGDLVIGRDRAATLSLDAETARSELSARVRVAPDGALLGSTLAGRLSASDAFTLGMASPDVHARGEGLFRVDARLGGTMTRPTLAGRVATSRLRITGAPTVVLEDASVIVDVDRDRVAWQSFAARTTRGSLDGAGRFAWRSGELEGRFALRGVRVEDLLRDITPDAIVTGAVSGELRFTRPSSATGAFHAHGSVRLDDGSFPALERLAPELARYGVFPLAHRATRPAVARFEIRRGVVEIADVEAAVDGALVRGGLVVRGDGAERRFEVDGEIVLAPGALVVSRLTKVLAAVTSEIVVPVRAEGRRGAMEVRTDVPRILESVRRGRPLGKRAHALVARLNGPRKLGRG